MEVCYQLPVLPLDRPVPQHVLSRRGAISFSSSSALFGCPNPRQLSQVIAAAGSLHLGCSSLLFSSSSSHPNPPLCDTPNLARLTPSDLAPFIVLGSVGWPFLHPAGQCTVSWCPLGTPLSQILSWSPADPLQARPLPHSAVAASDFAVLAARPRLQVGPLVSCGLGHTCLPCTHTLSPCTLPCRLRASPPPPQFPRACGVGWS